MNKKLELEAKNYTESDKFESPTGHGMQEVKEAFIDGATTSKYVKVEKLNFAIDELQKQNYYNEGFAQEMCLKRISELMQQLKDLEK